MVGLYYAALKCDPLTANTAMVGIYEIVQPLHVCAWPDSNLWLSQADASSNLDLTVEYTLDESEVTAFLDRSPNTVYRVENASEFLGIVNAAMNRDDHRVVFIPSQASRREMLRAIRWVDRLNQVRPKTYSNLGWILGCTCINADERVFVVAGSDDAICTQVEEVFRSVFFDSAFK